ncbi:MAG: SDR family NAD(P)-dependent oxidoreductase [Beijerinckiaceae bacterium]|nr:SDR family NAD(P)-dependent oxidoreductase [Beijerinckiaceae bacterium]
MYRASPQDGIVWITGASDGIGRAVALALASKGYRIAATARRQDALARLVAEAPGRIVAFPGDVTDRACMAEIVAAVEAAHGPIALALLNAGVYYQGERAGFDALTAWRTVETNLGGMIFCLDPLLARMAERGRGQIAMVASLAGYRGIPGSLAYGASKSAVIHLAEGLKLTYEPEGLTIQVITPGFVRTAMTSANDYAMPFMVEVDEAARRIVEGLARGGFEITFPKRLAYVLKAACLLPNALFFPLMARAARRTKP